ncbi:MAG: ABC transporter [Micrococcales bacterium]|nr:MAG: ABC transporter [Micrococcales bacterium]PIE27080.1 MAG: ABC transporter [Micrococcales bacterium]
MTGTEPLAQTTGLTVHYGSTRALNDFSFALPPGRIVGLLGENGCGKTTLLKVLGGVWADYQGDVRILGHRPGPLSKGLVSFLPDTSFLPDGATARSCLRLYRDFFADFDESKALDQLGFFGLDPDMRLRQMSKGMREKAQIALAMSRNARVFLLDEPISGVDPAAREIILDGIVRNLEPDATVLICTHLVHDLEPILDSVVFMRSGRNLLSGAVDDLRAQHNLSIDHLFREVYRCSAS